jgi:protein-S-isoprenylcysteine O-methyltransferase Ste14
LNSGLNTKENQKLETFISIQTRGQDGLTASEKIEVLQSRKKRMYVMIAVNFLALLFFVYSWFFGISSISDWVIYAIVVVFGVNVGMIFYQLSTLHKSVAYLNRYQEEE